MGGGVDAAGPTAHDTHARPSQPSSEERRDLLAAGRAVPGTDDCHPGLEFAEVTPSDEQPRGRIEQIQELLRILLVMDSHEPGTGRGKLGQEGGAIQIARTLPVTCAPQPPRPHRA
jgi:hypothetical protein